jgi:hypothetical protein
MNDENNISRMLYIIVTGEWKAGSLFWNMRQAQEHSNFENPTEAYFLHYIIRTWLQDKFTLYEQNFPVTFPCEKEFFRLIALRYGGKSNVEF